MESTLSLQLMREHEVVVTSNSSNNVSKARIVRLVAVYLGMLSHGLFISTLAGFMLDFGRQTGADVDMVSVLLTWMFAGAFLGAMVETVLYERMHPDVQLAVVTGLMTTTMLTLPFHTLYPALALAIGIIGYCRSAILTGGMAYIFEMFSDSYSLAGILIQGTLMMSSLGSAMGPFIMKPFITTDNQLNFNETNSTSNSSMDSLASSSTINPEMFYPFLINSTCVGSAMVLFLIMFVTDKSHILRKPSKEVHHQENSSKSLRSEVLLFFFCVTAFCVIGLETMHAGLLHTYAVEGLGWDEESSNLLITVFFASFMVSRVLGVPAVRFIHPLNLWAVSVALLWVTIVLQLTLTAKFPVATWFIAAGLGMAIANLNGLLQMSARSYFEISGKIVGMLQASGTLGALTLPGITGYVFKAQGVQYLPYVTIVPASLAVVAYVTIRIIGHRVTKEENTYQKAIDNEV